jgi:hypothetical protein
LTSSGPNADRYAFYKAYGGVCGYCPNSIDFGEFEIDHILPQHLAKDPAKWAHTLSDYGLPPDFMMDGDENRLPACRPCNGKKHGNLLAVGQVAILVAKARTKALLVQRYREETISKRRANRLLADLAKARSSQAITPEDLVAALRDDPEYLIAERLAHVSPPIDASTRERVIRAFGSASDALLSWPQETDGCWLERPELSLISERAVDPEISIIAVLGEPGSGKSALLARLGCTLRDSGRSLLAIKADLVPRDVATIRDLDEWLGLPESIVDILDRLASETPVTVLVDQLDSLALLMDSRTGRLSALLALILQVSQIPKVTVVVSIRSFDAEHDQRLKDLLQRRGTCKIELAEPPWPEVEKLLVSREFQTASWSEEVKQILRIPQHLKIFVAQFRTNTGPPTFMNYQAMLEQIFRERVLQAYGGNAVHALYAVADALAEEEELWLPVARFDDRFETELHQLQEANILIRSSDGTRLGFTHQTVFDYVRARSFTASGAKLAEFVLRRQDSLAVRPPLWSTLNYIRNADPHSYEREVSTILNDSGTRLHVKLLVITFLGTVSDPAGHEVAWMVPLLADDSTRPHAVQAIQGSKRWRFLLRGGLEAPARLNSNAAWQVSWAWRAEVQNDKDFVLHFVERSWIDSKEFDNATLNSLGELKSWDERAFKILAIVLSRTEVGAFWICDLARKIVQNSPEIAIRLVRLKLDLDLTRARAKCTPDPPPPPSDAPPETSIDNLVNLGKGLQPLKSLLDHRNTGWYGLENVAKAAPAEFIEAVWPWVEATAIDLAGEHHRLTVSYATDYNWRFGEQFPGYLAAAIWDSVVLFAEADAVRFVRWASNAERSASLSIHRLIVRGLTKLAAHHPEPAVKYLLGDRRRLAVSSDLGGRNATEDLIEALGPVVSNDDLNALVAAVQGWRKWTCEPGEASYDERMIRWNYEAQNALLSVLPPERLRPDVRQRVIEEAPKRSVEDLDMISCRVASPVSAAAMRELSDEDLVVRMREYPDSREHGPSWESGGSLQLAQAFGEFAKTEPLRCIRILRELRPGDQELPAGRAIEALARNESVDANEVIDLAHQLVLKGFGSEAFAFWYCYGLHLVSERRGGLDDQSIDDLESSLVDAPLPIDDGDEVDFFGNKKAEKGRRGSILFGGRGGVLPQGNYGALSALTDGLLRRTPPEHDRWLAILEKHLERREDARVWIALCRELRYLVGANRERATLFVRRLIERYPTVLESDEGAYFLAMSHHWLPSEFFIRCLDAIGSSGWSMGQQAVGELMHIRGALEPDDKSTKAKLDKILADPAAVPRETLLGLAYSAAHTWADPRFRHSSQRVLLSLIPYADDAMAEAIMTAFSPREGGLPCDQATLELLSAVADAPSLLSTNCHCGILIERMKEFVGLGFGTVEVARLTKMIVDLAGNAVGDMSNGMAAYAGDLVDIAITLQRSRETRAEATWIFERLLAVNAYHATEAAIRWDRRI